MASPQRTDALIQHCEELLQVDPANLEVRHMLSAWYLDKYNELEDVSHLNTSIMHARLAADASPPGSNEFVRRSSFVGQLLGMRCRHIGDYNEIDTAIKLCRDAYVCAAVLDLPAKQLWLISHNLSLAFWYRYQHAKVLKDLDDALELIRESITVLGDNPKRFRVTYTLVQMLVARHERLVQPKDLDEAQEKIDFVMGGVLHGDGDDLPRYMGELAQILCKRFIIHRRRQDIDSAISAQEQAIDMTRESSQYNHARVRYSYNLVRMLMARHDFYRSERDLQKIIDISDEILLLATDDNPLKPNILECLASGYFSQAQESEGATRQSHLENSISIWRRLPGQKGKLAEALFWRVGSSQDEAGLEEAIRVAEEAIQETREEALDYELLLLRLGNMHRYKYESFGDRTNHDEGELARQYYIWAIESVNSSKLGKFQAYKALIGLCWGLKDLAAGFQAGQKAIELVGQLIPRGMNHGDTQQLLIEMQGLGPVLAAYAIELDRSEDAVLVLETCRGLLSSQLLDLRSDLTALRHADPGLAQRFEDVRRLLNAADEYTLFAEKNLPTVICTIPEPERVAAGEEFERLLAMIRTMPGFENYLLPLTIRDIQAAASEGPIVMINVAHFRCDALIIDVDRTRSVRLPKLAEEHVLDRYAEGLAHYARPEVFCWLWEDLVRPILDALGIAEPPRDGRTPRLWWIPTGSVARFPLHAAGHHLEGGHSTAIDCVVSSYATSVRALLHTRRCTTSALPDIAKHVTLVGMESTPSYSDLLLVRDEIEQVEKTCKANGLMCERPDPLKEAVISSLKACKIFHFAGHGLVNNKDPLQSCLLLSDWQEDPLTVLSLLDTNMSDEAPFLAFLSACGTGQLKTATLMDEGMHLLNALQLAGFRHSIGTLWPVHDDMCVRVTTNFYEALMATQLTDDAAARALHESVKAWRDRWVERHSSKAQSLYVGAGRVQARTAKSPETKRDVVRPSSYDQAQSSLYEFFELADWVAYVHYGA